MIRPRCSLAALGPWLPAVLTFGLFSAPSLAESLTLRNETKGQLVVQSAGVVRGALQRNRPFLLGPGEVSPSIVIPGNKVLSIYDARVPTRVLYQGVIPGSTADQFYGIVADAIPTRVRLEPRRPR